MILKFISLTALIGTLLVCQASACDASAILAAGYTAPNARVVSPEYGLPLSGGEDSVFHHKMLSGEGANRDTFRLAR